MLLYQYHFFFCLKRFTNNIALWKSIPGGLLFRGAYRNHYVTSSPPVLTPKNPPHCLCVNCTLFLKRNSRNKSPSPPLFYSAIFQNISGILHVCADTPAVSSIYLGPGRDRRNICTRDGFLCTSSPFLFYICAASLCAHLVTHCLLGLPCYTHPRKQCWIPPRELLQGYIVLERITVPNCHSSYDQIWTLEKSWSH